MRIITNVTAGDQYTDAATIQDVIRSNGGYFLIQNNDVFMELQYNIQGQLIWTQEVHIPTGAGQIFAGTCGIKFRNAVAGSPAILSAAISENKEPSIAIGASGLAQGTPSKMMTGIVASNGAIVSGTGFTVNHLATGRYQISFNNAFSVTPNCQVTSVSGGATSPLIITMESTTPPSTTGFFVTSVVPPTTLADGPFHFLVNPTV